MGKMIIENNSRLDDFDALYHVESVIKSGRVSNDGKQYGRYTIFGNCIGVATYLNKNSDRFVITNEYKHGSKEQWEK